MQGGRQCSISVSQKSHNILGSTAQIPPGLDRLKRSCPLSPTVGTADNRRESLDAPSEHARQPHTGAEHLRLNASVSGALRGTEGSNLASSSGESANRRSLARSGSLQSTLPAQAPSWGLLSALRLVHSAGVTRIALLTKRRFSVGSAQTQPRVIFTARDRRPTPRAACLG